MTGLRPKNSVLVLLFHAVVLVLVLQVWRYFVKHDLVTLVVIMILKDIATSQVLFIVSLFCAWNIISAKCLCLLQEVPVYGLGLVIFVLVLVLRIWSCLHHWCLSRYV